MNDTDPIREALREAAEAAIPMTQAHAAQVIVTFLRAIAQSQTVLIAGKHRVIPRHMLLAIAKAVERIAAPEKPPA